MEIITRQQAITSGFSKYFTGEPCKNNHISPRYLQSGTCQQCIGSQHERSVEDQRERLDQRERRLTLAERKVALAEQRLALRPRKKRTDLVSFLVTLHYADVEFFKALLLASAMEIDPKITTGDLIGRRSPKSWGNHRAILNFQTFQSEVGWMRERAQEIDKSRGYDNRPEVIQRSEKAEFKRQQLLKKLAAEQAALDKPREWTMEETFK